MNAHNRTKRNVVKGRRWIFSKKKMKDADGDDDDVLVSDLKKLLELKQIQLKPCSNNSKNSKLIPKLEDILKKSVALGYFLEFLQDYGKKYLLEFWMEAETFGLVFAPTSEFNSVMACSTRSSPCMQRYSKPGKHSRNASVSSMPCSTIKSKGSFSKAYEGGKNESNFNFLEEASLDSNYSFATSSHEELNILSDKSECNHTQTCLCEDNEQYKPNHNNKKDNFINIYVDNIDRTDQINLMHPSNHEWSHRSRDKAVANSNDISINNLSSLLDSSLRKRFDSPYLYKSRSSTTSMEELRQHSIGRSIIVDAMAIYSKYICGTGDFSIDLPTEDRHRIEGAIGNKDRNNLDPNIFVTAQEFVFGELSSLYEKFLTTTNMINYQIKILEENALTFNDVLYCENILFYFMEFLDQTNSKSALEFYIAAQYFEEDIETKTQSGDYDVDNTVKDAMCIYEKYFSMKCEKQLIKDDKLRIVLENNICSVGGPQPNCFCIPLAYAWTTLNEIYMPLFVKSDIYSSYITHLKKVATPAVKADPTPADSQTLLDHSPTYEFNSCQLNLLEDNLEDFWFKGRSESSSGLKLGHVNEFGIFNSEMEPEPSSDKGGESSVSRFSKAMKNLLRRETEESEQLAWRRAEKIIADIQKETASNP